MLKKFVLLFFTITIFMGLTMCASVEPAPEPEPEPEPVVEPIVEEPEPEPEPAPEPEEFIVTEELYTETLEDIRSMVENLNKIISEKDFETWKSNLTDAYIAHHSDPALLKEYTDRFKQRGYNYRINDFEDYFTYLVVSSRLNAAVVDEIQFIDPDHVTAFTKIKDKMLVLYYLEKVENKWKIGLEPEN